MDHWAKMLSPECIPFQIDEMKYGTVLAAEQLCADTYYLMTQKSEYYAVLANCAEAVVSKTARAYGEENSDVLLFDLQQPGNGHKVVQYEIQRYRVRHGISPREKDSLYTCAVFAAEEHPEYFGPCLVPADTPRGRTTRSQIIANGICLLETEYSVRFLSIAYPVWVGELTDMVQRLGLRLDRDRGDAIDRTMGFLFFPPGLWGVVFYELLESHPELEQAIVSREAVIAAIWRYCPQYAMSVNLLEQTERQPWDLARWLNEALGTEIPVPDSAAEPRIIHFDPDAQTVKFLALTGWE